MGVLVARVNSNPKMPPIPKSIHTYGNKDTLRLTLRPIVIYAAPAIAAKVDKIAPIIEFASLSPDELLALIAIYTLPIIVINIPNQTIVAIHD